MFPVKAIPLLLVMALSAMALSAMAAPNDPGETAVDFLEKVRAKNINLEPGGDTALSPQTSEKKRKEIARRLERLAGDLGGDPLEVGAVKLDDDLAAVLVRKIGGFDPSRLQVFSVALVKRGAEWAAAPVPASFENSGVGFAALQRKRLDALEDWMLREQALDLEKLREQSAGRMRLKIEESLPAATLRNFTSNQTAERFFHACEQRNLPEMFGLLGGLSASLPADWPLRLKAADAAVVSGADVKHPWRLLISPDVLRIPVHHEEDGETAMVSIACLDPSGNLPRSSLPRIEIVHLELAKSSDGLWRIEPPPDFLESRAGVVDATETDEQLDSDLVATFLTKLSELYPPTPLPTAEKSRQSLLSALRERSLAAVIRLIRLDGDPHAARKACVRAAQIWWALREPSTVRRAVPLGFREDGETAAEACQFFSARNPDRLDLRILYFKKSADGWHWTPEPPPETETSFREWTEAHAKPWQDEWQQMFLAECAEVEKFPDSGAPSEEASRKLMDAWLQAARTGDVLAALRLTARLNIPDSKATLLRNLGYEMTGVRLNRDVPTITGVRRAGIWSAVGIQIDTNGKSSFPLYPIIATPAGPRLLLEIDLFAGGNRSRDFLNKTALERLRKFSPSAADDLKKLSADHQADIAQRPQP
jgi:hypothetical protein